MNPPISTEELKGEEINVMLEENLSSQHPLYAELKGIFIAV